MSVNTSSAYKRTIYTGGAEHKLKVIINGVAQDDDFEENVEEISINSRVFPYGSNTFNINELITKEAEMILHNVSPETLIGTIKFSIGTYLETLEGYSYISMGTFNITEIQDNGNQKITVKMSDNSIKLDVPYNAEPLISDNGGSATLLQILNDICDKCGVQTLIEEFPNDDKLIGIYDNTINARIYINYIAGQAGLIPIIDRNGKLDFQYPDDLYTHKIPLNVLESYELGEQYTIGNVEFESGILKYTTVPSLPETYTQVDYIESNGTQYIDTGIYPYKTSLELTFSYTDLTIGTYKRFIASYASTQSSTLRFYPIYCSNNKFYSAAYNNTSYFLGDADTEKHTLIFNDVNNKTYLDGVLKGTNANFNLPSQSSNTILIFATGGSSSASRIAGRLYGLKIYDKDNNNQLVRNFVPCYRNSDKEIGLYDLISNTFFTNEGTGDFTYGKSYSTMYVDSANLYVNSQEQIDDILSLVKDFSIDSVLTGKILGDPAVDAFDLIQVYGYYDENDNFVADQDTIVFTTLANQSFKYNGKCTTYYETKIGKEERKSNVSLKSEETYKKSIKTELDLINGSLKLINDNYLNFLKTASHANYVEVENMYANGITKLEISGQMSLLYPSDTLYPSNTLYPLDSYLIIEDETQNKVKYQLGINYLNTGDKYVYTYEFDDESNGYIANAKIIRNDESEEILDAPLFELAKGSYKIYMESFPNMNYNVEYVIQNDLTETMATNTQLATTYIQTMNNIELKAQQMVNKDEIIASLNVGIQNGQGVINLTGNSVTITSDNFQLSQDGSIIANNGEFKGVIKGSAITGGTIELYDEDSTGEFGASIEFHPSRDYTSNSNYMWIDSSGFYAGNDSGYGNKVQVDGETGQIICTGNASIGGDLTVYGSKNRIVKINDNDKVLLNAYETATPYFGDIGSNKTNSKGECKIFIEDIFKQTIETDDYKVFIQECNEGHLYVIKYNNYFIVKGTPNLDFDYEIKAIQKGYKGIRLKKFEGGK